MNHVAPRSSDEVERIREIVARHPMPNHVTSFDIHLDEFEGDPIVWVVFHATELPERSELKVDRERVSAIRDDLLDGIEGRYPHFWFESPETPGAPGH